MTFPAVDSNIALMMTNYVFHIKTAAASVEKMIAGTSARVLIRLSNRKLNLKNQLLFISVYFNFHRTTNSSIDTR